MESGRSHAFLVKGTPSCLHLLFICLRMLVSDTSGGGRKKVDFPKWRPFLMKRFFVCIVITTDILVGNKASYVVVVIYGIKHTKAWKTESAFHLLSAYSRSRSSNKRYQKL